MKKVLKVVVDVLAWIILIAAFLITLMIFSSSRNNGIPNLFGFSPMSVQSDSMAPTFKKGDLIFVKKINDMYALQENDVITFYTIIEDARALNTHRIVEINDENGSRHYITRGDNNPVEDEIPVYPSDIVGKWSGVKVAGGGKVLDFLRSKTGFFICVVIPMALFFLFELYKFIVALMESKKAISNEEEEEIKRKAIEEYLAKQQAEQAAAATSATATASKSAAENVESVVESTVETATEAVEETVTE